MTNRVKSSDGLIKKIMFSNYYVWLGMIALIWPIVFVFDFAAHAIRYSYFAVIEAWEDTFFAYTSLGLSKTDFIKCKQYFVNKHK